MAKNLLSQLTLIQAFKLVSNQLPPPHYAYQAWLVRKVRDTVCEQVNLGVLVKEPKSGSYILVKTGPGNFDDTYEMAISDDPRGVTEIQHLLLVGALAPHQQQ